MKTEGKIKIRSKNTNIISTIKVLIHMQYIQRAIATLLYSFIILDVEKMRAFLSQQIWLYLLCLYLSDINLPHTLVNHIVVIYGY